MIPFPSCHRKELLLMLYYRQALVAPSRSELKHSSFLGSHTCLTMPGLFDGGRVLSSLWINALSIISRLYSVWNKEMETFFFVKGVIHLLMVQWDLGNVCFLTPFWWKVKKMHVGRLQFELIFGLTSAPWHPSTQNPLVVQQRGYLDPLGRLGSTQWFWPISQLLEVTTACVWCPEFPAPSDPLKTLSK